MIARDDIPGLILLAMSAFLVADWMIDIPVLNWIINMVGTLIVLFGIACLVALLLSAVIRVKSGK